ncbi:HupE/UreJ family protein [Hydrogenophaga sp.]|uniref:HupE/UreJ family protein n=1 Tax=Hydrogenophaga sp. TaxID=1904254 RepID=UPI00272F85C1|nr:HupE/UreJ family protein [Hydrogenophaga sp.]MDP1687147.1 HupE/UreJ family protein [Hydrogenophaga sp.]
MTSAFRVRSHPAWWLLLLACPLPALAHGSIPGATVFYTGFLHPFLAPAHAISLAALALWLGGQGEARKGLLINALALGLLLGALLAGTLGDPNTDLALLVLALACSLMVALQWKGPRWWVACVTFALGTAVALGSGDPAFSGMPRLSLLGGGCIGAVVLVGQIAFWVDELVVRHRLRPALIAVRIVASWLSAITLLLVALAVK